MLTRSEVLLVMLVVESTQGFLSFLEEQLARPVVRGSRRQRDIAQELLVLSYLRQTERTDQEALERLRQLERSGSGPVKLAAGRLICRWDTSQRARSSLR
jgi:hypothetical protein